MKFLKHFFYILLAVLVFSVVLMLIPRAHGIIYPERAPMGYHFLWTSYMAIALGLEDVVDTKPDVPEDVEEIQNIEYKNVDGTSLQLDLYKIRNIPHDAPLLVFVHGGSWIKGKRSDMLLLVLDFARRGYVTATVSYRLGSYPECVEDVSDAVKWFHRNGQTYGYDPNRIALVGASAGAHLAMMAAYGWDYKRTNPDSVVANHSVKAVVNLFGPVDLTTPYARSRSTINKLIGKSYEQAPELYEEASPLRYVDTDVPPTLIIHGTSDELVPNSQADQLREKLQMSGVPHEDYRYPLWPHALILVQRVYNHCTPKINNFLEQYLKPES